MNKYPTIRIIFDRRKVATPKKEGTVEIEIYYEKKRKWLSTGVKVLPKNWHPDKRVISRVDSQDLNIRIENIEKAIINHIRKLMIDEKLFTWSGLESSFKTKKEDSNFIKFIELSLQNKNGIAPNTRKNHRNLLGRLKDFKLIQDFKDLTKENVTSFNEWMHSKGYKQASISTFHKILKVYIFEAIQRDLISQNPYTGFKIDRGKSDIRRFLNEEELTSIENAKTSTKSLEKVKDLFLFQCYTGLAYVDLSKFDFNQVIVRNGKYVVHDVRKKTGEEFYIILLPKAIEILKKYDYKLPIMTNQQYNLRLKIVADAAGLDKRLTSHMGRHTYATMCLNSGVKIEVLADMMGHADIKTTQIYAKLVNSTVENAYDILEERDIIIQTINQINDFIKAVELLL